MNRHRNERALRRRLTSLALAGTLLTGSGAFAQPAEQASDRAQERAQTQGQMRSEDRRREQVYGWELMNAQERAEFQSRMRNASSAEERARIRAEHHVKMQERARAQGVTLPDMPAQGGRGSGDRERMKAGSGDGERVRPGAGSGKGRGPGR